MIILDNPPLNATPEELCRYLYRVVEQIQMNFDEISQKEEGTNGN